MDRRRKRMLTGVAVAVAAIGGGGGAIAATKLASPQQESQAVLSDAAQRLGVTPDKLTSALEQALEARVDAAVAAGRITQAQGDAIKQRIASGQVPLVGGFGAFGFRGMHGHDGFGQLADTAATYLGLTQAQLRSELAAGKSLAQIATEHGKTADGLKQALSDAIKQRLDSAVSAGRMTAAQEQQILQDLSQKLDDEINETHSGFDGHRHGFRPWGPPPANAPANPNAPSNAPAWSVTPSSGQGAVA